MKDRAYGVYNRIIFYRLFKMEHGAWMYDIRRNSSTFLTELTNILDVAQKLAQISLTKQIHCPCCDCCNKIVWADINAIKMHLIKRGFVKGYKTWPHHGEAENTFNNADIGTRYDEVGDQDADENDHVMTDDAFGCEDQNDDHTGAPQVDKECDVDMEEMLHHIELEVLLGNAKGLENFETLKKAAKDRMYDGCGKEWTVLCSMLHLLIVTAKIWMVRQ
jgi:hypothetical protein